MDFVNVPFPAIWQGGAFILMVPALIWAVQTAPWRRFEASESSHVWYAAILCLTGLWSIRASLASGLTFHLLGASLFTLLTGPRLALIGTALVVGIVTVLRDGWWGNYALNILVLAAMPITVTAGALRATERWLPPNLFVYIFVVGFFDPGVAMFAAGALGSAAAVLSGALPATDVLDQFLPYLIYLAFGEATITGMLITLFVVYQPRWVTTFDDARYLRRR
jgi:uncharacterized membrane protein